ncbi:MAG: ferrous iron transporter B [Phycisphaerales bacterium]|nr:MAG: ferrous iron transporter B [Phycisphaerales bacterium]
MNSDTPDRSSAETLLARADALQGTLARNFRDELVQAIYSDAGAIAQRAVRHVGETRRTLDETIDRIVTSRLFGLPLMLVVLAAVFWVTVTGANYPSQLLATGLFWIEAQCAALFDALGIPVWITGLLWHGTYRGLAWVVSVMLPPMAIFFPCFTILEDLGYLPRVAFNLDWLFRKAGAHGKQALTMSMGFGCNAAGIIACRVIDSPRERLIAILTNNFVPCNGRFPTLIMLAVLFVAAQFPAALTSVVAAGTILMVVVIGVLFTLIISAALSRTVLKGEASAFTLELPPYRRPSIGRILYTSLIDRTIFVLWRAVVVAAPAGAVIWILGNVVVGGQSLDQHVAGFLNPLGHAIGLDGVILLAYIIAIPANEIVVPTMLMVYMSTGVMTEEVSGGGLRSLLIDQHGWTLLTAVNLMLFSLLHNPCATTILTMWKETRSAKWTALGALMPLGIAFAVCFIVAQTVRLLA